MVQSVCSVGSNAGEDLDRTQCFYRKLFTARARVRETDMVDEAEHIANSCRRL